MADLAIYSKNLTWLKVLLVCAIVTSAASSHIYLLASSFHNVSG